jgi:hypothetical protein
MVMFREDCQRLITLLGIVILFEIQEEFIGAYQIDDLWNFLLKRFSNLIHLINVEVLLLILFMSIVVVPNKHNYPHILNVKTRDIAVIDYELKRLHAKPHAILGCAQNAFAQWSFLHEKLNNTDCRQLQLFDLLSSFHIIIKSASV